MSNLTATEKRLTAIAQKCGARALGFSGQIFGAIRVEKTERGYLPVAGSQYGGFYLGATGDAAARTLREILAA